MKTSYISKKHILMVCHQMVQTYGIQSITIRAVAKQCNVSIGSIYNYFPSKNKLLHEVIESIWKDIFKMPNDIMTYDFMKCLQWMCDSIQKGKQKYPDFLKSHAMVFHNDERIEGQQHMEYCIEHMKQCLLTILQHDQAVKDNVFNEQLTRQQFVSYILTLFLSSITNMSISQVGIMQLVKHCLYE